MGLYGLKLLGLQIPFNRATWMSTGSLSALYCSFIALALMTVGLEMVRLKRSQGLPHIFRVNLTTMKVSSIT
ncbi:MAG: hypothetical protein ACE366_19615 [Bradymonadia bacterium]